MLAAASSASSSAVGGQRRAPKTAGKDSGDDQVQGIIALLQVKKVCSRLVSFSLTVCAPQNELDDERALMRDVQVRVL
jgi:hypothetical protein